MKRSLSALSILIPLCLVLVSCGNSSSASSSQRHSNLKARALVSNPLHPVNTGGILPVLELLDASKDLATNFGISLLSTLPDAGMLVLSPDKTRTLVFSPSNNSLGVVDNTQEAVASGVSAITLPGATESMFVWTDNATAFAAVPGAAVAGSPAGVVEEIDLVAGKIKATIPIPGARFIVSSSSGNQILVLSDSAGSVTLLSPSLIASGNPLTPVTGSFDKPVWAVFSADGATAYVMNCGPECGGTTASVTTVDMTQSPPSASATPLAVPAATTGLLDGGTLYVAGTPPPATGVDCQASLCGVLTVFPSAGTSSLSTSQPITDGYHDHMALGANGQLFIGSRTCTNAIANGNTPARGCLSVFNSSAGTVFTSTQNGDATGIEPIPHRSVVYVCEGGKLTIYDTLSDLASSGTLAPQATQVNIIGQAVDVKFIDF